jgi:hypothetical protein
MRVAQALRYMVACAAYANEMKRAEAIQPGFRERAALHLWRWA